jgi:hypothetical protein
MPDTVIVGTFNLAPTADAGQDQLVYIGASVQLDATGSFDPEGDALSYSWTLTAPAGSSAVLVDANTPNSNFVPDVEGDYQLTLVVSDFLGPGELDAVQVTAVPAGEFATAQLMAANDIIVMLEPEDLLGTGSGVALLVRSRAAARAIQRGQELSARGLLVLELKRLDGCVLRGAPDETGAGGVGIDFVTNCSAQVQLYHLLNSALEALQ